MRGEGASLEKKKISPFRNQISITDLIFKIYKSEKDRRHYSNPLEAFKSDDIVSGPADPLVPPHLGSALQLVHRWIICCLASGALGGTNELSQRLGHIFDSIYQNHLEKGHADRHQIITTAWERDESLKGYCHSQLALCSYF